MNTLQEHLISALCDVVDEQSSLCLDDDEDRSLLKEELSEAVNMVFDEQADAEEDGLVPENGSRRPGGF